MDPFYMLESNLHEGCHRIIATKYIEDLFAANKQKEIILAPYFAL